MRFTVQRKVLLLGAGLSFLLMLAAFLTSFFIYKNRSETVYEENVNDSMNELYHSIGFDESLANMNAFVNTIQDDIEEHLNDEIKTFDTFAEEYEYYSKIYTNIYPQGVFDMSMAKLKNQSVYLTVSSALANASITAGSKIAYAGLILKTSDGSSKFIYLFDSKFRFDNRTEGGHPLGSQYVLQSDDLKESKSVVDNGYKFNGKDVRMFNLNIILKIADQDAIISVFVECDNTSVINNIKLFAIIDLVSLSVAFIILIIFYILMARYVIIKNIIRLTNASNTFTEQIQNGKIDNAINPNIKTKDEIGELSKSFYTMEEEIINYTNKIEQATRERERINADLELATKIQLEALPKKSLNDENILIEASIESAKEVGGDFYDYFYIDNNHLALIVADVSGKGVPAALFMMKTKELIKSKLLINKNIEDVCFEVNNELLNNNEEGLFITAFVGVLDVNSNELELINCGHEKPFIISNGKVIRYEVNSNFILGGIEDFKYEKDIIHLNVDDKLFIHTDGLNEAINTNKEEFGYDRIAECLNNNQKKRLTEILNELRNSLKEFSIGCEAFDDVTMVLLDIKSSKISFKYEKPDYSIIEEVTNKFDDYYSYLDKSIISVVNIIFDELLNNYISYEKNDNLIIEVNIEYKDNNIIIEFKNNGIEFNPLEKEINVITEYSDDLKAGGLGLTIIRTMVDDIKYERINDNNVLTIKKNTNNVLK